MPWRNVKRRSQRRKAKAGSKHARGRGRLRRCRVGVNFLNSLLHHVANKRRALLRKLLWLKRKKLVWTRILDGDQWVEDDFVADLFCGKIKAGSGKLSNQLDVAWEVCKEELGVSPPGSGESKMIEREVEDKVGYTRVYSECCFSWAVHYRFGAVC
ncbi:hypothetical protein U1Q18_040526 [Sarracenia purpurea var. burkii]